MNRLLMVFLLIGAQVALAQGPLAPPGSPAPSMKSLAQIEPRTDVLTLTPDANGGRTITQPGSYFLSGNVTTGPIIIQASNVTLDLTGFALIQPTGPPAAGIMVLDGCKSVRIHNGTISGFQLGLVLGNTTNVTIENAAFDSCQSAVSHSLLANSSGTRLQSVSFSNCATGAKLVDDAASGNGSVIANCRFIDNGSKIASADLIVDTTADNCSGITFGGGLNGMVVSRCTVSRCSGDGPFILATNVSECSVTNGKAGNVIIGRFVSRCAVVGISFTGAGVPLSAIIALGGGFVENSLVSACESSGAPAVGISASRVSDCRVGGLQAHGSNVIGISSLNNTPSTGGVFRCTVDGTIPDDSSMVTGISSDGPVDECTVKACKSVGVTSFGGGIRNCVIGSSEIGIQLTSNTLPNRIEGNTLSSCSTAGMSVAGPALIIRNYFKACTGPLIGNLSATQVGEMVAGTGTIPSATGSWANFVQP